ncbi:kinesin-like protein KIF23 [Nilaparvata lugens]|uniref:kinesin-like protein KIF23 n=1 Tax=Nilaparvata lugens TaxID=108931 RepID=UPI00193D6786|nr:kinesin-like protein KIF23 [Nilaparvata lugens]
MKRMKQNTVKSTIKKARSNENIKGKHPLQVYCRVRPLQNENESSCVRIESANSLLLTLTDVNRAGAGLHKQMRFTFKSVFDETANQDQVFTETSLPLVQNLIAGKNGLLFTYGVSNSGKSFTMDGTPDNYGIMPRSISVLFNSINIRQAPKYLFKPDKLNGFDVQSEPDALLERQRELMSSMRNPKSAKKKDPSAEILMRGRQVSSQKFDVNEENVFAVFITYIEIYNNCVYDLLEDSQTEDCTRIRPLQPKIIREDGTHNMYVHGVDEIEVMTPEEALDIFYRGQKRRRLAHTALNTESSRSHSVFTIRLVQAPLDVSGGGEGGVLDAERKQLSVSQLSLVDLAGSERTSRAKTHGQRLREAGNINNSLMTLRNCFELLRENQRNGTAKMIPYRESRLTHLFKNYFDGDGDVRMIICLNPRADDSDEINHVLKFAEMSQEVKVNRIRPTPTPTPAKEVVCRHNEGSRKPPRSEEVKQPSELLPPENINSKLNSSFLLSCRFQQSFPVTDISNSENEGVIAETLKLLLARKEKAKELHTHTRNYASSLRSGLEAVFSASDDDQKKIHSLTELNREHNQTIEELQRKINQMESEKLNLKMKCTSTEHHLRSRENELADREQQLAKEQEAREKEKMRMKEQINYKAEKLAKAFQRQKSEIEQDMLLRDRNLMKVKQILDGGGMTSSSDSDVARGVPSAVTLRRRPPASSDSEGARAMPSAEALRLRNRARPPSKCTVDVGSASKWRGRENMASAAANPRLYRRSRSAGPGDVWLDHRPPNLSPDTLCQPVMGKAHHVTKLTHIKDVSKSSKYCLTVLDKDSDGDIETCLYKGDVLPTPSGGAQVLFNDVEILKQKSPINSPPRKRASPRVGNATHEDTENHCALSLEGHGKRSRC